MSPEQARGEEVDQRTDLWSFAVVLYEMVTGHLPFKGGHPQVVIHAILEGQRRSISSVLTGAPPSLDAFLDKALAADIAERFQDAESFQSGLRSLSAEPAGALVARDAATRPRLIPGGGLAARARAPCSWRLASSQSSALSRSGARARLPAHGPNMP